jgi:hypothetical protein
MNKGISKNFHKLFPGVVIAKRPEVDNITPIDPNWLAGFIDGVGCFFVNIVKDKSMKNGVVISLKIELAQHTRDLKLLERIIKYLGCGSIYKRSNKAAPSIHINKL